MSGPTPTPLGDAFENDEIRQIERDNSSRFDRGTDAAMMAHRERPYLGQPHTHHGKRGRAEVRGLTVRDIADCIARGFGESTGPDGDWSISWEAVIQNSVVNIEKMMGTFPNIKKGSAP